MIIDALKRWMGVGRGGDDGPPEDGEGAGGGGEMIPCEEALARIYEFLDGELDGVTHEEVDRHFQACNRCYPHLRLENAFREALHRAVEEEKAPPELKERVLELMEAESGMD